MRRTGIIGALAGMLGRVPAQIRENFQLAKMGAVKVLSPSEAKGEAPDPHALKRAFKKLNRAARRRVLAGMVRSHKSQQKGETRVQFRKRRWLERAPKALRAAGHNVRVRGH